VAGIGVALQLLGDHARFVFRLLQHHRRGAVAEQHGHVAVIPVKYCEISSTPMMSAFLTMPLLIMDEPMDSPYMKLVHAVLTSNAAARAAPMRCCTPERCWAPSHRCCSCRK